MGNGREKSALDMVVLGFFLGSSHGLSQLSAPECLRYECAKRLGMFTAAVVLSRYVLDTNSPVYFPLVAERQVPGVESRPAAGAGPQRSSLPHATQHVVA